MSSKCNWSMGVVVITVFFSLLTIAVLYFVILQNEWPADMIWLKYLTIIILLSVILAGIFLMPLHLTAYSDRIVLRRLFSTKVIQTGCIKDIRVIDKSEIKGSIRVCGSGGWLGYWGWFYNSRLGNYTMSATDLNKLVFIGTDTKRYVFSCSDNIGFVEKVKPLTCI